jgi:hypothetical protein
MTILDQVAKQRSAISHRPATVRDLFVLRLAQKLNEATAFEHYAELARKHNDDTLLLAYRRTAKGGRMPPDPGRQFHVELAAAREQYVHGSSGRLLAMKIERRSIAVAVFNNQQLEFHDLRHVPSQPDKAEATVLGFVRWVLTSFELESAALERMTNGNEIRRSALNKAVVELLRASAMPVWEVAKKDLLGGFSHPALGSRRDLRQMAASLLWSQFHTERPDEHELDAAALGLHVQIERLFLKP